MCLVTRVPFTLQHYGDVIMGTIASKKSPASRLFTQPFIQTQINENVKAPRHWPLCREFTGTGEFPAQRASYAEMFPFDDVIMERPVGQQRTLIY